MEAFEARKPRRQARLSAVNAHAAGIDVGAEFHVVAVPPECDDAPVRTFQSFTGDLHRLADWLLACRIETVAMESTGVYWIPLYEILEARGMKVLLANARDVKHVPGRKTDVNDAQWLQQLHTFGLLRGSFHPPAESAARRAYVRQRERLLEYAAAHVQHMQKALTQMNLKLQHVVAGVDLTRIHGLGPTLALKLVAECGTDLSAWPTAKHFVSWLCLSPGNKVSGGKLLSARTRRTSNRATSLLRLAAVTVGKTDSALGAFYRRLGLRIGKAKAITATARKLAIRCKGCGTRRSAGWACHR